MVKGICNKCGERRELVLAESVCAICNNALDWTVSRAAPKGLSLADITDWILVVRRQRSRELKDQYEVFRNTTYAEMKRNWAGWANRSEAAFFVPFVPPPEEVTETQFMLVRPATSKEIADYEDRLEGYQSDWEEQSILEKWGIGARYELINCFGDGDQHDDVVLLSVLHAEAELNKRREQFGLSGCVEEFQISSIPEISGLLERVGLPDLKPEAAALVREATEVPFDGNWEGLRERQVQGMDSAFKRLCRTLETQAARSQRVPNPGRGLSEVAGMEALKDQLRHEIIEAFRNPDLYRRYRVSVPNGMLFYGPPGCGKTYVARCLAEELGYFFQYCRPSDVASPYIHDTVRKIRELFTAAIEKAPSVLFIDEFEAFVPARSELGGFQHYKAEEVNEFLANLEGCAEKNVLVIAATNEPDRIDPAVRRTGRFDKLIYIPPPDAEARAAMLVHHLEGRPLADSIGAEGIAAILDGYSASDIKFLTDEAARMALARSEPISTETLLAAMGRVPPSITKEDEERYSLFRSRGI
jgi:AAA+ superfamily predicted ATPase